MQNRFSKTYQLITACSALVFILLLLLSAVRSSQPEWKKIQKRQQQIALSLVAHELQHDAIRSTDLTIQQLFLDDLGRTDRCVTCHISATNPVFVDQPIPLKTHSGRYLEVHPIDQFGCTICHGGQGQAVDKRNAHARSPDVNWSRPLISMQHIQSSCGQCHLAIFSNAATLDDTDIFKKGHIIFQNEGCLGCHKARGVGGSLGPDLTEQGEKTKHEYSFTNVSGDHTISNWLFEHFKDPEMVSPGSNMLALRLDDAALHALVTFTMGMNKPDIPFDYFSIETLNEFKGNRDTLEGSRIYPMVCSACHGSQGEGKDYQQFETGVASISNPDFLAVASLDLLDFTLMHGRGNRQMQAWTPRFSGLHADEIYATALYLKSRQEINSSWSEVQTLTGNTSRGRQIYATHCLMCHGDDGRAAQIVSISNKDFLVAATNEFLHQTIQNGRRNTAMPGWGDLSSQEMADVISFLRHWHNDRPRQGTFDISNATLQNGESLYHYRCSRCHGTYGQGDSGPALMNKDLLAAASNFFLAEMITKGRHNTAMFGWDTDVDSRDRLSDVQVADIIVFLRESADKPKEFIYAGTNLGHAAAGKTLFEQNCAACHGQTGEGRKAPALNNQELLNGGTNGYFYATISLGRRDTQMPSWGRGDKNHNKLSIQERHDIAAFIRQWQDVIIANVK